MCLAFACFAATLAFADEPPGDSHLVAGVDAFRAQRFDTALVEFKVARTLGARGEVAWYIAATLTKLHRSEEALEAFAAARTEAPEAGDALLDYYEAMACYEAQLFLCADALLARVEAGAGPRVAGQAKKVRADIAAALALEPPVAAIDACLMDGRRALAEARTSLAALRFEEARALAGRRVDGHGRPQALAGLDAARAATRALSPGDEDDAKGEGKTRDGGKGRGASTRKEEPP